MGCRSTRALEVAGRCRAYVDRLPTRTSDYSERGTILEELQIRAWAQPTAKLWTAMGPLTACRL